MLQLLLCVKKNYIVSLTHVLYEKFFHQLDINCKHFFSQDFHLVCIKPTLNHNLCSKLHDSNNTIYVLCVKFGSPLKTSRVSILFCDSEVMEPYIIAQHASYSHIPQLGKTSLKRVSFYGQINNNNNNQLSIPSQYGMCMQ